MFLYHGSFRQFRQFVIDPKLAITTSLTEGYGIYMVDKSNIAIASSRYTYMYQVNVDRSQILNMIDARVVRRIVRDSIRASKIFPPEKVVNQVVHSILCGDTSATEGHKHITDWLDSLEFFYDKYGDRSEEIFDTIEKTYKKLINERLVVKCYDKSLGRIYVCKHNPEKLQITGVKLNK